MKVSILGTEYSIEKKKYDEDKAFDDRGIAGYCDGYSKRIVLCDMSTYKGWKDEPPETLAAAEKANLRHEIVHAFFSESGLMDNALEFEAGWATNEELVDWIALQGPKIMRAWLDTGCLE